MDPLIAEYPNREKSLYRKGNLSISWTEYVKTKGNYYSFKA